MILGIILPNLALVLILPDKNRSYCTTMIFDIISDAKSLESQESLFDQIQERKRTSNTVGVFQVFPKKI